tara:strand:- start:2380 stop:3165 length:786 start_codon:yes stop_codon:yes gene_type:complete
MSSKALHEINASKHKRKASFLTAVIFVSILVLCFFLTAFTIQDPPPGEQYVAVGFADLGEVNNASGETETEIPSEFVEEVVEENESIESVVEPIVTEEIITAEKSEVVVPTEEVEEVIEEVTVKEPIRTSAGANLINAFASSGGGGSEGETEGMGNQGAEDGKIEGSGVVTGDDYSAYLDGATMTSPPRLDEKPTEEGLIRMKIVVNSDGKVISSIFDAVNSDNADTELIRLAMIAAKSTIWEISTKPRRLGYMDFRFELE